MSKQDLVEPINFPTQYTMRGRRRRRAGRRWRRPGGCRYLSDQEARALGRGQQITALPYIGPYFARRFRYRRWRGRPINIQTLQDLVDVISRRNRRNNDQVFRIVFANDRAGQCVNITDRRPTEPWPEPWNGVPNVPDRVQNISDRGARYAYCVRDFNPCAWESVRRYLLAQPDVENNRVPLALGPRNDEFCWEANPRICKQPDEEQPDEQDDEQPDEPPDQAPPDQQDDESQSPSSEERMMQRVALSRQEEAVRLAKERQAEEEDRVDDDFDYGPAFDFGVDVDDDESSVIQPTVTSVPETSRGRIERRRGKETESSDREGQQSIEEQPQENESSESSLEIPPVMNYWQLMGHLKKRHERLQKRLQKRLSGRLNHLNMTQKIAYTLWIFSSPDDMIILNAKELAKILNVSPSTIRRHMKGQRIGANTNITENDRPKILFVESPTHRGYYRLNHNVMSNVEGEFLRAIGAKE